MIAQHSIQEVMNRADVVEVIGQFLRLKKRGINYIANCPFHNEKTPSFNVSPNRGIYKCFGCGKGGNVVTFVQEHEKLTYPEAIRWLADFYKIELQETEKTPEQVQKQQIEESLRIINDFAAGYFQDILLNTEEGQAIGLSYFKQRGFRKEIIDKFRLGYCPEDGHSFHMTATQKGYNKELMEKVGLIRNRNDVYYDTYRGRVIFPIQNMTGRVLGFGARILKKNDKAPKYINSPENELYVKSRVLYGMYQSRQAIAKQDECFLVEGYTDVISLHQGGVENVVASSGTSLTEDQLRLIGQLTKNLTILYDGDAAGVKAALRGLDMALSQSFNVQLVLLPEGEDPDSFVQKSGAAKFHEYVKGHKQDVIGFRMEVGLRDVGDDPVKKSKLVNEIAESVSRINKTEDFVLQDHYIRKAAQKLDIDQEGFIALVNKFIRERLDGEERHRRNEERRNIEQPSQPVVEEIPAQNQRQTLEEQQEWQLIHVLVEHGSKPVEGYVNIATMIAERVDPDLLETPLVRRFFDAYFSYVGRYHQPPEPNFFIHHADQDIQRQAASLLQPRQEMSPNWSATYGIETLHGEQNYLNEAESALCYFEMKKIKFMQAEIHKRIQTEKDEHRLMHLIAKHVELKQSEAEILKRQGTVIIKLNL